MKLCFLFQECVNYITLVLLFASAKKRLFAVFIIDFLQQVITLCSLRIYIPRDEMI